MRKKLLSLLLCVLLGSAAAFGQTKISGTITGAEDGQPVSYATVIVKGTSAVATSGEDGTYSITLPSGATTLEFSFFGMKTLEVVVGGRNLINVVMEPDNFMLDETVVIGYGTVKKRDVAGSVANIQSDDLSKAAVENFQKAMQGKAAGVQVTSASGTPGGAVSILIRGRGSMNADTDPLYIIDGVQVTTGEQGGGILNSTDALAGLNPDDIESIDILKDGASASIYGAQAANGVIFITTKKGKAGKTNFSFKSSWGWQTVANTIPVLNGPQFAELALTSYKNLYGPNGTMYLQKLADYQGRGWGDDGYSNAPSYDWFDAVFKIGFTQEYQISMSGGNDKTTFFISAGYMDDNGTMMNTWFKRASARLNLNHEITKWLKFSTSNSFNNVNQRQTTTTGSANPARVAFLMQPTNAIYDSDGNYIPNINDGYYEHNIVQVLDYNKYTGTSNKWTSGNDFEFKIIDGLTFKSSYGVDYMEMNEHQFIDPRTRQGKDAKGQVSAANSRVTKLQTDQVVNYQRMLGENHRLNAMVGFSFVKSVRTSNGSTGRGIANPDMQLLSSTAIPFEVYETYTGFKTMGLFGRLGYTFKDKYILTATVRRDGSSRFGAEERFGTFPSISGAWRMSAEPFMQGFKFLNDFKWKASYGVTGNSNIGNFIARRLYTGIGEYDGQAAIYPSTIGNDALTWEESHSANFGLSASMFKNRISLDVDYYITNTKNLLYYRPIPSQTGFTTMPDNIGGVRNTGWEFLVSSINIETAKGFKWASNLNFSFTHNEVTSLIEGNEIVGGYKVGESITSERAYRWAGVNPSDGRPMYYDKDNYITYNPRPEDRIWTPGTDPTFFGGLTNTLSYKGIELSFTFQFQQGARSYWSDKSPLIDYAADCNSYLPVYEEYWRNPGDRTWVAKPMYQNLYPASARPATSPNDASTLMYEKTDFIKLKTVSLSYTLPKKWTSKAHLASAQIYAQAYNLWTTTTYPGYDPEFSGSDRGTYPQSKTYSIGLKLDF